MSSYLAWFFSQQDYMPHGMCFLWQPQLIWLHVLSDTAIALAYYSMPVVLIYFATKRRDLVFRGVFVFTGAFILACGTTHVMNVWTLWQPDYRLDGLIKAATALVSVGTAIGMWRVLPLALALPSQSRLEQANRTLADEITERRRVEAALRDANARLEDRVHARTAELAERNAKLQEEVARRGRVEDELRQSEARFRTLWETSPDAVVMIDTDNRVRSANPSVTTIFGYQVEEVVGQDIAMLQPEHLRAGHRAAVKRYLETGTRTLNWRAVETLGRHRDGHTFPIEVAFDDLRTVEGRMFAAYIRDITVRKESEQKIAESEERLRQAQRLESVGQLAGGIAHDFNNLLTVVIGNLELMEEEGDDPTKRAHQANRALHAALRGAELTQRLLAYARRQPLAPQVIDLNALVISIDKLLQRTLGEGIEIKTHLAPALWPCHVDPGQLETALVNLAINARDAMPRGGTIVIETANATLDADYAARISEVVPGDYTRISVSDEGSGMRPEVLARAFEPYFTTKEVGKGSGLGLSIVYGFVKQSGGHVSLYSEPGHGTTVRIYLPRSTESEITKLEPQAAAASPSQAQGTALLVEDDPDVRMLAGTQLRSLGLHVLEAADAAEALAIIARDDAPIDLLFTDIILPGGVHGPQLAKEARQRRPGLKVLFASGYTEDAIHHHGHLEEGGELLSKPYRKDELARRVIEILSRK